MSKLKESRRERNRCVEASLIFAHPVRCAITFDPCYEIHPLDPVRQSSDSMWHVLVLAIQLCHLYRRFPFRDLHVMRPTGTSAQALPGIGKKRDRDVRTMKHPTSSNAASSGPVNPAWIIIAK